MSDSSTGSQTSGTRLPFDYPGFGSSDPLAGSPTFDRLAETTGKVIDALGVNEYAIYMFDFGRRWVSQGYGLAGRSSGRTRARRFEYAAAMPPTEPTDLPVAAVRLAAGSCLGPCPVYDVTLRADGRALWRGVSFVDRIRT
jgi:pimeloyl-ACP methyl ester carboxylesterase